MNDIEFKIILGITCVIIGIISVFSSKKLNWIQDEMTKNDLPLERRRKKLFIGGVCFLVFGIYVLIR